MSPRVKPVRFGGRRSPLSQALGVFVRHLPEKIAALVLAVLVWFTIRQELTESVTVAVTVKADLPIRLILTEAFRPFDKAEFRGPRAQIEALKKLEPIVVTLRVREEDLVGQEQATMTFSADRGNLRHAYGHDLVITATDPPAPVELKVAILAEKAVTVNLPRVMGLVGEWESKVELLTPTVRVAGPAPLLKDLTSVEAEPIDGAEILARRGAREDVDKLPLERKLSAVERARRLSLAEGESIKCQVTLTRSRVSRDFAVPFAVLFERADWPVTLVPNETDLVKTERHRVADPAHIPRHGRRPRAGRGRGDRRADPGLRPRGGLRGVPRPGGGPGLPRTDPPRDAGRAAAARELHPPAAGVDRGGYEGTLMGALFGTDGIRGEANREPLTPETLARIGRAIGRALIARGGPATALVGRDTRISSAMVAAAVSAGLASAGVGVRDGGELPTPVVAFLMRKQALGAGIAVSASHNPWRDNGVKVFLAGGFKADPEFERAVELRLADPGPAPDEMPRSIHSAPVQVYEYIRAMEREFPDRPLEGLTLVADCANGAPVWCARELLRFYGATVHAIADRPNGCNINEGCGALHPGVMAAAVKRRRAHGGVSFDGDGDRAIFADETGRVLDGDAILAILARRLLAERRLPKRTVVATVMSNLGLARSLAEEKVKLVTVPVGDRSVVEAMRAGGFSLGGEQSGHIVVKKGSRLIGDGVVTALRVFRAITDTGRPLSELAACFTAAPQHLVNVRVARKPPLLEIEAVRRALEEAEKGLGGDGRILLRYSGTEPLARVMVEGLDAGRTRLAAESIAGAIRREIGGTA